MLRVDVRHTRTMRPSSEQLGWLRSIVMLARAEASGALVLEAHGRAATIHLARGAVVGFDGELGPRIGELIGAQSVRAEDGAYGAAAVAAGRVSRNDLAWALRKQMRLRARELARWGAVSTRWEASPPAKRPFTDPMSACDLVADVLRAYAESCRGETSCTPRVVASALGLHWVERAALFPHELAATRGLTSTQASRRFAAALAAAGLTDAPVEAEVKALTRLHARVRSEGARAVLGFAHDADARRRALRRVAGSVHPDRFASDPRLGRISSELVATLSTS